MILIPKLDLDMVKMYLKQECLSVKGLLSAQHTDHKTFTVDKKLVSFNLTLTLSNLDLDLQKTST